MAEQAWSLDNAHLRLQRFEKRRNDQASAAPTLRPDKALAELEALLADAGLPPDETLWRESPASAALQALESAAHPARGAARAALAERLGDDAARLLATVEPADPAVARRAPSNAIDWPRWAAGRKPQEQRGPWLQRLHERLESALGDWAKRHPEAMRRLRRTALPEVRFRPEWDLAGAFLDLWMPQLPGPAVPDASHRVGGHWGGWALRFLAAREVFGAELPARDLAMAERLFALAARGVWWMELGGTAVAAPLPRNLKRDAQGRPHCLDGPAAEAADGLKLWALHGVLVERRTVLAPETDSVEEIRQEANLEVRRLRIERFAGVGRPAAEGWRRYLVESGAELVDKRRNDIEGTRELLFLAGGTPILLCHCPSTGRMYALECAPLARTCEAAQRSLWEGSAAILRVGRRFQIIGRT